MRPRRSGAQDLETPRVATTVEECRFRLIFTAARTPSDDYPQLQIDFVSDVSCPWCAIGLGALETALARVAPDVAAELRFQPFELNPRMASEGQDIEEHIREKYGSSPEQQAQMREMIRQRGEAVGFEFGAGMRKRIYNTFDAHRLLHWAELESVERQRALKKALLRAYFTDGENPSDHDLLLRVVGEVGLDVARAREILAGDEYADETRAREKLYSGCRHPLGARHHHQQPAPYLGRTTGRGVRAGATPDCRRAAVGDRHRRRLKRPGAPLGQFTSADTPALLVGFEMRQPRAGRVG